MMDVIDCLEEMDSCPMCGSEDIHIRISFAGECFGYCGECDYKTAVYWTPIKVLEE